MKISKSHLILIAIAITACALLPSSVLAQASQPSAVIHNGFASQNVDGASLIAHRPGQMISNSRTLPTHQRIDPFKLPTITATQPSSIRDAVLQELVTVFLAAIQSASLALQAAITSATGT